MAKFKKGDRVRVITEDLPYKVGDVGKIISIQGDLGGGNVYLDIHPDSCILGDDIELCEPKSIRDGQYLEVGDVVCRNAETIRVLAILNGCYLMSDPRNPVFAGNWYAPSELEERGWKIKRPVDGAIKMTQAQIEEKLGYKVQIVEPSE